VAVRGLTRTLVRRILDRRDESQPYLSNDASDSSPMRSPIYGRVENVTDKHYETTYEYGTLGRAGSIASFS
jgi:hypothetical protein